jgi:hypothetical protein
MELADYAQMIWSLGGRPIELRERPFGQGFLIRIQFEGPQRDNALALAIEASQQLGFQIEAGTAMAQLVATIPRAVYERFRKGPEELPEARGELPVPRLGLDRG